MNRESDTEEQRGLLDPIKLIKQRVGKQAASYVKNGNIVGLGTGSTTAFAIKALGELVYEGIEIKCICTSKHTADLAKKCGLTLTTLEDTGGKVDISIDGADEVEKQGKNLIKGGGAAHTCEKVISSIADLFIVGLDESKLVDRLGAFPVPIEVIQMAVIPVMKAVEKLGGEPEIRHANAKDGYVITDLGNMIIDAKFETITDPAKLEAYLNNIPGVVENGIFVGAKHNPIVIYGQIIEDGELEIKVLEV